MKKLNELNCCPKNGKKPRQALTQCKCNQNWRSLVKI